ncbi:MAG: methyl viologen-reducing hydrogenase [Nitrospirae bacterium]|nr:methyl viologen-reducing hydrogenase [Magnetococcales bacterium]HAT50522.1 methyl viologen-reducing hydrogenase [Alphaproteobacteria bacterium]
MPTRISIEWLSGCSGCELAMLDLNRRLPPLLKNADLEIVRLPVLLDVHDYPEADVGIITGAVRGQADEDAVRAMWESCQGNILAYGTCAVFGGPHGASLLHTKEDLLADSFTHNPTTPYGFEPDLAKKMLDPLRPVDQVIPVAMTLQGCPPHLAFTIDLLRHLGLGHPMHTGQTTICHRCQRHMMPVKNQPKLQSLVELDKPSRDTCFLCQGVICMGSVTADNCYAACTKVGVPCFGCGGPSPDVILEPPRDVRFRVADLMHDLTEIPVHEITEYMKRRVKMYYAYSMASPVINVKPDSLF